VETGRCARLRTPVAQLLVQLRRYDFDMTRSALYGARDPREIPAYPQVEAARYAGVPLATLRRWIGEREGTPAVIELPQDSDGQLSFYNLVEAFVLEDEELEVDSAA
jgi:hypothetical protein